MNRYVCIHGHFYQPPRENPWLGEVESQDTAYPYHDWNEKITDQCYLTNTAAHIFTGTKKLAALFNNYTKISFNFGPTLLFWMQRHAPGVYRAVLEADKVQVKANGHGGAIAQPYHHMIMPLAHKRDKRTQILWGIRDFQYRFQRLPEGMWLPETAVDTETLEIMTSEGIKFTVLAPHQALKVKEPKSKEWINADEATLDTKIPYVYNLPNGKSITIFFYDGAISHDIAFGDLLNDGKRFAERITGAFSPGADKPQLVHIATDGETYGHHHRFGDMGLAYCINYIETNKLAECITYGAFLEKCTPAHEVVIAENSSWSCSHGVERWRSDCGCKIGIKSRWTQRWRAPLREAIDWLRNNVDRIYEDQIKEYAADPWKLRDDYIDVIVDSSEGNRERFLSKHGLKKIAKQEIPDVMKLLEMQRHAMLMYTSCAWFFDEISGIEPIQAMQCAGRVIQLAKDAARLDLEKGFVERLEKAPSNIKTFKNGANIYAVFVRPSVADLNRVAAHYATAAALKKEKTASPLDIHTSAYEIRQNVYNCIRMHGAMLATGSIIVRSSMTLEEKSIDFTVLHEGGVNLIAGTAETAERGRFDSFCKSIRNTFIKGNTAAANKDIAAYFEGRLYSLQHLFKDEQREILNTILYEAAENTEAALRTFNEHHYPILQPATSAAIPLLRYLSQCFSLILTQDICKKLQRKGDVDCDKLHAMLYEARRRAVTLDAPTIAHAAHIKIDGLMEEWSKKADDCNALGHIVRLFSVLKKIQLDINLWKSQNIYYNIGNAMLAKKMKEAQAGNAKARQWMNLFTELGTHLKVEV